MLVWPERPTCHDSDGTAAQFGPAPWRQPRPRQGPGDPYAATYRTCGYCGSIHPADLLEAAARFPLTWEVADWKYGWPHKIYVDGLPNLAAGQEVHDYTYGQRENLVQRAVPGFEPERTDWHGFEGWRVVSGIRTAPATLQAKWYNIHLRDLDGDTFTAVADLIATRTRVRFIADEQGLHYQVGQRH